MMRWVASALVVGALAGCDAGDDRYTETEIDYFLEVALGTEFGGTSPVVRRWQGEVGVAIAGEPTAEDRRILADVIGEINTLVAPVRLELASPSPEITVFFVPPSEFSRIEPNYVPGNVGFFWWSVGSSCGIVGARVLIASEEISQRLRSHLIREELTQVMGLARDSYRYRESIFYELYSETTQYAPIDRTVIEMLYRPQIRPCMDASEARHALSTAARRGT